MKKLLMLLVLAGAMPLASMAQDDVYFTPSKKAATPKEEQPTYYCGSKRSVDEYNRYGKLNSYYQKIGSDSLGNDIITFMPGDGTYHDSSIEDTVYVYPGSAKFDDGDDYAYTRRMSRWDGFYDPWFYDTFYGPYGWYGSWYDPWYRWYGGWYGWYDPWYYGYAGWYSPYYYGYYGWGWPYRHGWYGWNAPHWGGTVIVNNCGMHSGGYTGQRTWTAGRSYGNSTRSNRSFGNYTSRSAGNRSFGSRSTNNNNFNNTRSFNNNSVGTRSFGGSVGGNSGSFGGGSFGGGRSGGSFGGGGGHFGGGRR